DGIEQRCRPAERRRLYDQRAMDHLHKAMPGPQKSFRAYASSVKGVRKKSWSATIQPRNRKHNSPSRPLTLSYSVNELIVGVECYFAVGAAIEPRERRKEEKPVNTDA